ncbi:bifunctional protein folC [Alternaria alternata]|nr:bifunctional protein folC [Alternaria alternata]
MCIGFSLSNSEGWTCRQSPSSGGVLGSRTPHIQLCDTIQSSPVSPACSCRDPTCGSHRLWRSWTEACSAPQPQPAMVSPIHAHIARNIPHSRASPSWQLCDEGGQSV